LELELVDEDDEVLDETLLESELELDELLTELRFFFEPTKTCQIYNQIVHTRSCVMQSM